MMPEDKLPDRRKKKSIFKSKTFWFNALGIAAEVSGVLPVNTTTIIVGGAANIILRLLTKEQAGIVPKKGQE
jgi:hypothetical protein